MEPNQNYPPRDNPEFQPQPQTQPPVPVQAQPFSQPQIQPQVPLVPRVEPQLQFQLQPYIDTAVDNSFQAEQQFPQNFCVMAPVEQPLPEVVQPIMAPLQPEPIVQQKTQPDNTQQLVPKKKISKKLKLIIIAVLGALLIGFVSFVVYAVFFTIDYKDVYTKSDEVARTWNDFSAKYNKVNDLMNVGSDSEIAYSLSEEKISLDKFKTAYKQLDGLSALKDKAVKEKYDLFKKQTDVIIPETEAYFEIVTPLHEFLIRSAVISSKSTMTDIEINNISSPLINSTNSKLILFGKDFSAAAKKFYAAIEAYKVSQSAADYAKVLDAKNEFTALASDKVTLDEKIGVVTSDELNKLADSWQSLRDEIANKYKAYTVLEKQS